MMAVLWFSIFIVFGTVLQRKTGTVLCQHLFPLLFLLALTIFRLAVPIETHFTHEIVSTIICPAVQKFFRDSPLTIGSLTVSGAHLLLGIWVIIALFLCIRRYLLIRRDKYLLTTIPAMASQSAEQCLEMLLS
jgi:hypothetical protein